MPFFIIVQAIFNLKLLKIQWNYNMFYFLQA